MTKEYEYRKLNADDLNLLLELHSKVYGWAPSLATWAKKYSTDCFGNEVIGFLAIHMATGEIAAYYGVFPVRLVITGKKVIAAQSGDTMTHPAHQGRGLFTTLAKLTYQHARNAGIALVFGFPNENSFPGFIRKLDWIHHYNMNRFVLWVPTVPMSEIWRISGVLARFHRFLAGLILKQFALKELPDLSGSVFEDTQQSGVLRDKHFYDYKRDGLYALRISGATVWVKLGKAFEIGDISKLNELNVDAVIFHLKLVAALLGYPRLRTYCSPDTKLARIMATRAHSSKSLPYGAVSLDGYVDGSSLAFTYIDYDTY